MPGFLKGAGLRPSTVCLHGNGSVPRIQHIAYFSKQRYPFVVFRVVLISASHGGISWLGGGWVAWLGVVGLRWGGAGWGWEGWGWGWGGGLGVG